MGRGTRCFEIGPRGFRNSRARAFEAELWDRTKLTPILAAASVPRSGTLYIPTEDRGSEFGGIFEAGEAGLPGGCITRPRGFRQLPLRLSLPQTGMSKIL